MSKHSPFFVTVVEFSGSLTNHIVAVLIRLVRTHDYDFVIMAFGQNPKSYRSYLSFRGKYWWSAGHKYGFRKHSNMIFKYICMEIEILEIVSRICVKLPTVVSCG